MPACFLKRILPFFLTLIVGVMLGTLLGTSNPKPSQVVTRLESAPERRACAAGISDDSRTYKPRDVDQKARIVSRAEPSYTEEARENLVEGTVVLRSVFSAGGEVTNIRVKSGLPYGLTERAIEAARQIRFTPAIKDGRAVSQYIQIEYNFSLF